MASQPKGRKLQELLSEMADEILGAIGSGKTLHEVSKQFGVWPDQIDKFFCANPELRESYRLALVKQKALNVIVDAKSGKKPGRPKKGAKEKTNAELVAEHEEAILMELCDGMTVTEIAAHLMVRRADVWKHFQATDELRARFEAAKVEASHAHAERALLIPQQGVALDMTDAKVMEMQVDTSKWYAGKLNPTYDAKQQVDLKGNLTHSVSIDIKTD